MRFALPSPCKSTGIKGWVSRNPPFALKAPKLCLPLFPCLRCNPPLLFWAQHRFFSAAKLLLKCTLPHLKRSKFYLDLPIRERQDVSLFIFSSIRIKILWVWVLWCGWDDARQMGAVWNRGPGLASSQLHYRGLFMVAERSSSCFCYRKIGESL